MYFCGNRWATPASKEGRPTESDVRGLESEQVGYTIELDDEERLRREARAIHLGRQIVGWSIALSLVIVIAVHTDVYAIISVLPRSWFTPLPCAYIVYLLLLAVFWLAAPFIIFEFLWRFRLDSTTFSNDTFRRTKAFMTVVDIYAESKILSFRSLLVAGAGAALLWDSWRYSGLTWWLAVGGALVLTLLVLTHVYPKRPIGPYFIDNILFVCIRSEQSTMSHQEAADQLANRESPKMRRLRPDLYY